MASQIRLLDTPEDMTAVEELQRQVWGSVDLVPAHLLITAAHNGGLVLGAFVQDQLVGFVFGFPGLDRKDGGLLLKHCSHMLAVLPEYRNQGIGYKLKRAQWQMVRQQGIDLITWTYDPLLSQNANLNIAHLGAICSRYLREAYGRMNDDLNQGLPSDRLQVELWINSSRVIDRMDRQPRKRLDLAHYLAGGAQIINPTRLDENGWADPPERPWPGSQIAAAVTGVERHQAAFYILEIPTDFQRMRQADPELALKWRLHARALLEDLFDRDYLITDFVYLAGENPRSFYVLSHGERTLGA